jgi:hypothetical protein
VLLPALFFFLVLLPLCFLTLRFPPFLLLKRARYIAIINAYLVHHHIQRPNALQHATKLMFQANFPTVAYAELHVSFALLRAQHFFGPAAAATA